MTAPARFQTFAGCAACMLGCDALAGWLEGVAAAVAIQRRAWHDRTFPLSVRDEAQTNKRFSGPGATRDASSMAHGRDRPHALCQLRVLYPGPSSYVSMSPSVLSLQRRRN